MKPALLTEILTENQVRCNLCAHRCKLAENKIGICGVRKNIDGVLFSLNYDRVAATHPDPIEKKPLYHCLPGSTSFSIATMGCNFSCKFCQNHTLAMVQNERIFGEAITPEDLVATALSYDSRSIAYTYTEPTVYFELMLETAILARQEGLKNVMVTNGYMSPEALAEIQPYLDSANIDLKSYSDAFYKTYCGARLEPVKETIARMRDANIWVELTTLLIPGLNDSETEIREMTEFIARVDPGMPWHVSRFFPQHQLTNAAITPEDSIDHCLEIGKEIGIQYLYAGNIPGDRWSHTRCHQCGTLLIERSGYNTRVTNMDAGTCGNCTATIPGVWM